jgi:hypothetical protein
MADLTRYRQVILGPYQGSGVAHGSAEANYNSLRFKVPQFCRYLSASRTAILVVMIWSSWIFIKLGAIGADGTGQEPLRKGGDSNKPPFSWGGDV